MVGGFISNLPRLLGDTFKQKTTTLLYGCNPAWKFKMAYFSSASERRQKISVNDGIPGPKPLPVIGNLNLFKPFGPHPLDKVNQVASSMSKTYGPVVRLKLGIDIVFLFDPEDVATVFEHEGKYPRRPIFEALVKHRRQCGAGRYLHMGLFTDNGPGWAHLRTLVNPLLHPGAEKPYLDGHLKVAEDFVEHLKRIRNSEGCVSNMLEELYKYTQEAVGLVCFGTRLGCFDSNNLRNITGIDVNANAMDTLDSLAVTLLGFPFWKLFPTPAFSKLTRSQENFYTMVCQMIGAARQRLLLNADEEKFKSPFLASLLVQINDGLVDERDVILVIMELFQAAIDSTASTIVMTLYHLGRNRQAQQRLVDELDGILANRGDTFYVGLDQLKFLRACIKETFRLTCPVGGTARILPKTITLSEHDVEAGTLVLGNHPAISVNPAFVSEPTRYMPERWLRKSDQMSRSLASQNKIQPFVSLPFSYGARACPGRRIAQQEIAVFLIKNFRCTYDGPEASMVMRLNYVPDRPLNFNLFDNKGN